MVFAEAIAEHLVDGLSEAVAEADEATPPVPLATDRHVALPARQKAIRRGEEAPARRPAITLMTGGPEAIWRRLRIIGIGFEVSARSTSISLSSSSPLSRRLRRESTITA